MTVRTSINTDRFISLRYHNLMNLYSKIKIRWIKISCGNPRIALFRPGNSPEIAQLAGGNEAVYINFDSTGQLDDLDNANLNDRLLRTAAGTRRLFTYSRKPLNFIYKIPSAYRKPLCMSMFLETMTNNASVPIVDTLEKLLEGKLRHIPRWGYFGIHDFLFDSSTTKGKFTVELTFSMGVTLLGFKLINPTSILYDNHQVTDLDTELSLNQVLDGDIDSDDSVDAEDSEDEDSSSELDFGLSDNEQE